MRFIDRDEIVRRLTYDVCIPVVREAMIAFSKGETKQLLRSILKLSEGRLFGVMPGALGEHAAFGAKIVSVFQENASKGRASHQGLVLLFAPGSGAPVCVLEAGSITAIRTAAASAVATDALARHDASRLAIFGTGEQAHTHVMAIGKVRQLDSIAIWGRSFEKAQALAKALAAKTGLWVDAIPDGEEAAQADIICTVSASPTPILKGAWVRPGTHVNVVGSSYAGPAEIDNDLVAKARFVADSREGVLAQGAEFLYAKQAGLIGDDHVVGEIGQALAGAIEGRQSADQVTIYKSLGHIAQDLASAWALYSRN